MTYLARETNGHLTHIFFVPCFTYSMAFVHAPTSPLLTTGYTTLTPRATLEEIFLLTRCHKLY